MDIQNSPDGGLVKLAVIISASLLSGCAIETVSLSISHPYDKDRGAVVSSDMTFDVNQNFKPIAACLGHSRTWVQNGGVPSMSQKGCVTFKH